MYAEPRKRDLRIIPPGPNGLTMKYLVSFIGQKIFMRPIQENLLLENPSHAQVKELVHKERCKRCMVLLDVHALREHYTACSKQNNTGTGKGLFILDATGIFVSQMCTRRRILLASFFISPSYIFKKFYQKIECLSLA